MDLSNLTIEKFHEGLVKKQYSALEMAEKFFDYIEERDEKINAYLRLTKELALSQANLVDVQLAKGESLDILAGVPLAVKDNILIENEVTTAASQILTNYRASFDATVVKKLKKANVIFLGKTNLDEFAMGASTENSGFKPTKNPHDLERVPGGSSGGSAAAVASDMAIAALGSDTGGSVRQPSGFCGVVGLKPTYGAVSRYGLIAMASSLDQIGPITKTVRDAAILFRAISGKDEFDSTSAPVSYGDDILEPKLENVRKLKIGLPKEYFVAGLNQEISSYIKEAIGNLKSLKIEFREISLPHIKYSLSVYYIIMPAEVTANLARYDGIRYGRTRNPQPTTHNHKLWEIYFNQRTGGFGQEVQRRIILGNFVLSVGYYDAYYLKAQKVRRLIRDDFLRAFEEVDVILTPVTPKTAFKFGEKTENPLDMYLEDIYTVTLNLVGLPGISIPVKKYKVGSKELPVGFQLIGRPFREADILGIGQYYERTMTND